MNHYAWNRSSGLDFVCRASLFQLICHFSNEASFEAIFTQNKMSKTTTSLARPTTITSLDSELALPWELYQDLEDDALGDSTTTAGAIADAPNKTIDLLSDQKLEVHQTEELSFLPFGAGEFLQNILVKAVPGLSGDTCPQMVVPELSDTITAAIRGRSEQNRNDF